jgi:hypothetical protein
MDLSDKDKSLIIKKNLVDVSSTFLVQHRTVSISITIGINLNPSDFIIDIYLICFKIFAHGFKFLVVKLDKILQFSLEWVHFLYYYAFVALLYVAAFFLAWTELLGECLRVVFYCVYDKRRRQSLEKQNYKNEDKSYFDLPFQKLKVWCSVRNDCMRQLIIIFAFLVLLVLYAFFFHFFEKIGRLNLIFFSRHCKFLVILHVNQIYESIILQSYFDHFTKLTDYSWLLKETQK